MNNFGISVAIDSHRAFNMDLALEQIQYIQKGILEDTLNSIKRIKQMDIADLSEISNRVKCSIMSSYGPVVERAIMDFILGKEGKDLAHIRRVWRMWTLGRDISLSAKILGANVPSILEANLDFGRLVLCGKFLEVYELICSELSDAAASGEYDANVLRHIPFGEISLQAKAATNYLMGSAA